ncbi:hypothetical protein [Sphaerotilus uruguayifluvii]|uniref:Peptidase S8/S53 domain-containing protein n=1 Tax=Sphaerotilus uruguayifluvii TaxID=2735897 RepID=A0ABX2FZL2_9BURK|nr:hypothetical protein [Leptothrix sp. C29]NRT54502.1 hypothetical protein [Leptothrix sp. C29]
MDDGHQDAAVWQALPGPAPEPGDRRPAPDAWLDWVRETGWRETHRLRPLTAPARRHWLLVALRPGTGLDDWLARLAPLSPDWLRVPSRYRRRPAWLAGLRHLTLQLETGLVGWLGGAPLPQALRDGPAALGQAALALRDAIERFELGFAADPADWEPARPAAPATAPMATPAAAPALPAPRCVVGVIDDGIAFANRRLCRVDAQGRRRTRLLGLWDQGATPSPIDARWGLGRLIEPAEIDAALAGAGPDAMLDEDCAAELLGYHEARRHATHGTHVIDLAGGAEPELAAAMPALVAVQLPPAAIADTSCAASKVFIVDALHYVLDRADQACAQAQTHLPPPPVVINLSFGDTAGPRDGSSLFESALDELIGLRRAVAPFEVVLPEGNSRLERLHAHARLDRALPLALDWHVQPDDGTSNFAELRVPASSGDTRLRLTLQPPSHARADALVLEIDPNAPPATRVLRRHGEAIALVGVHPEGAHAHGRALLVLLAIGPTAADVDWPEPAPSGRWHLRLELLAGPVLPVRVDVQRDDSAFGRATRGRPSWLQDSGYRQHDDLGRPLLDDERDANGRPLSAVRRSGTINAMATGHAVRVIGGALRLPGGAFTPAPYSSVGSAGELLPQRMARPLALTEDSPALPGVLASGTRSGSRVALSGTSMAAPQWVRQIAAAWMGHALPSPMGACADIVGTPRTIIGADAELAMRSARRRGDPAAR